MSLSLLSLRELSRRRHRALLSILGIAIGVAGVAGIGITLEITRGAWSELFATLAGDAALEVVSLSEEGVPIATVEELAALPGVRAVRPVVQVPAGIRVTEGGRGRTLPVFVLGLDVLDELRRGALRLEAGTAPKPDDDGVLLESTLARDLGLVIGSPVRVIGARGLETFVLTGLLEPKGAAAIPGGSVLVLSRETAGRRFLTEGQVSALRLEIDEDERSDTIQRRIESVLPEGLLLQRPADRGRGSTDSLASTRRGLESISAISLVAGAFVILNAIRMSLGERRKTFATLRALGASSRQTRRLILREALLLGILGTVLGLVLGFASTYLLLGAMRVLFNTDLPAPRPALVPLLEAGLLGPFVALLAAFGPARRAARNDPVADLVDRRARESETPSRLPGRIGLGLLAGVAALVPMVLFTELFPPDLIMPATAGLLVGCVLALDLLVPRLLSLLERLRPRRGLGARLAIGQMRGRLSRTSYTVGVLFIAVVVAIGNGNSLLNSVKDVRDWYALAIPDDFFLRGTFPDTALLTSAAIPEGLADRVRALDGVDEVRLMNLQPARSGDQSLIVLALDPERDGGLPLDLESGNREAIAPGLARGGVVIGTLLARRLHLVAGDRLPLRTASGTREFEVLATCTEYTAGGAAVYMRRDFAREHFGFRSAHAVIVRAEKGAADALGASLSAIAESEGLMLQSRADLFGQIDRMMEGVVGFIWLLVALVYLVASLGIVNTLTMNVIEQTREIGLMRAIGLPASGVRSLVRRQALIGAGLALIPGLPFGILLSWVQTLATYPVLGHPVAFHLDPSLVVLAAGGALVLSLLAALAPARRAGRLPLADALQYE